MESVVTQSSLTASQVSRHDVMPRGARRRLVALPALLLAVLVLSAGPRSRGTRRAFELWYVSFSDRAWAAGYLCALLARQLLLLRTLARVALQHTRGSPLFPGGDGSMNARRLVLAILATLCAASGGLLLTSAAAQARLIRPFIGSFGTFSQVGGVAVEQSSGDVYVFDVGAEAIYKFNSAGQPEDFSALGTNVIHGVGGNHNNVRENQIAVDSSSGPAKGDIYVANGGGEGSPSHISIYSSTGVQLGRLDNEVENFGGHWGDANGVAVDPAGNVYVSLRDPYYVNKYAPVANPVTNADYTSALTLNISQGLRNIAVDSTGDVYGGVGALGLVLKYEAMQFGALEATSTQFAELEATSLASDPVTGGDIYLQGNGISQYEPSGTLVSSYAALGSGPGELEGIGEGIAVTSGAGGDLYAATSVREVENGEEIVVGKVNMYGQLDAVVPDVSTEAAEGVTRTAATLKGTVNPDSTSVSACKFEYGTVKGEYIHTLPCSQPTPLTGASPIAVSANLSGLTPATTYYYRVVATNGSGSSGYSQGNESTFETLPAVDSVATESASNVMPTSVTLNGSLAPDGADAHYYFEYVTEKSYNATGFSSSFTSPAPPGTDAGEAVKVEHAETTLSGLQPSTSYYYRLVAVNSFGTTYGQPEAFETLPAVDSVATDSASNVMPTSVTLNGSLAPDGADAHYYFEYVTEKSYNATGFSSSSTSPAPPGTDAGEAVKVEHAETTLSGLQPDTYYRYRLVAVNSVGTTYGQPERFATSGPPLIVIESTEKESIGHTSATLTAEIDPGGFATHYHFEYGPTESYGTSVPIPDGEIAAGFYEESVRAELTHLEIGATYHFRVVATNADSPTPIDGPDTTFTTLPPARIDSESVTNVTTSSATLTAQIDPLGEATTYHFEYGLSASYGTSAPVPDGEIAAGSADVGVSAPIAGLQSDTVYHYRVVTHNSIGDEKGVDRVFRTGGSPPGLPDGRAYEMVTPVEKQAHDVGGANGAVFANSMPAAPDGEEVAFGTLGVLQPVENFSTSGLNTYVAQRTASGWTTSFTDPPLSMIASNTSEPISDFSPDFSTEVDCQQATADKNAFGCALRHGVAGPWQLAALYPTLAGESTGGGAKQKGSSSDFSHIVFQTQNNRETFLAADTLGGDASGFGSLYEIEGLGSASPVLRLVSVDNSGNPLGESNNKVNELGLGGGGRTGVDVYQAVSEDGSTIYFTAQREGELPTIYARVDHTSTVTISNPSPSECTRTAAEPGGVCNALEGAPQYQGASADGTKVFFTTNQQLVNSDTDTTSDLYEYDFNKPPGKNLVQVSRGGLGDLTPGSGANVGGVVNISHDGSHVYFTASGVLTTLPNGRGQSAIAGASNMYVFDTETERTQFVATLSPRDSLTGEKAQAQTTPDGRYLVFNTFAKLITTGPEAQTDEAENIYRYDVQTGDLVRISIAHDGFGSNGNSEGMNAVLAPLYGGSLYGAWPGANDWSRAISDNGSYVVFMTPEPLQVNDTNTGADPGCELGDSGPETGCNVYEWHDGVTSLISGGQAPEGIRVYPTISATGSDIFFVTREALVPQDKDTLTDVYDARIGGGFPYTPPTPCSGESCQGQPSPSPAPSSAGSSSFTGPGNLTPALPAPQKPKPKPKTKPLTRAQQLAKALKACKKQPKSKRARCKSQAKKRYGGKPKAKKSNNAGRSNAKQSHGRGH
jgi:phosphodiesterase/alkaline phosphatase D-like protein